MGGEHWLHGALTARKMCRDGDWLGGEVGESDVGGGSTSKNRPSHHMFMSVYVYVATVSVNWILGE